MSDDMREYREFSRARLVRLQTQLEKRGFAAQCFDNVESVLSFFYSQISPGQVVGYGGSRSIEQLGILQRLRADSSLTLLDRSRPGILKPEKEAVERVIFSADIFLASANAVAAEGTLVNIDMWGNRTAAIEFGPRKVFLFVGRNKICDTIDDAIHRARNSAAVMNCIRFGKNTPCVHDGRCHDCSSPERICSVMSLIMRSTPQHRIHVLLVNDELGF